MAAPDDTRLRGERILDELRARMLRNYDRAGDAAAITKHRKEMLLRGAGPAELQQYDALVSVRITGRRGKPKGAQSLVRTKIGPLHRAEIGAFVFANTGRALNPTRGVMKAPQFARPKKKYPVAMGRFGKKTPTTTSSKNAVCNLVN